MGLKSSVMYVTHAQTSGHASWQVLLWHKVVLTQHTPTLGKKKKINIIIDIIPAFFFNNP
jgi:hypothetical protein